MVKMKDVAERAGVSIATVSNVITGKRTVSPEVQKTVQQAIRELDYHVNMVARGLKTQRTNTIGVVLPDVTKLFFNDVLNGIMDAAGSNGFGIHILSSGYQFANEQSMIASLRGNHVDAIILDSCVDRSRAAAWSDELTAGSSTPVVSLENKLGPRTSSVSIDCAYWSSQMTQHLIDLGRRRICYIAGPLSLRHESDRFQGYQETLRRNNVPIQDDLIFSRDFLSGSSYKVVQQALRDGVEFDAIQASNDQAAIGALKALKECRISVPEQVAVTGFDNLFPSTLTNPAITTVKVPRYTMGHEAVMECIRRINAPEADPRHLILDASLIVRRSSCGDAETTWDLENW